MLRTWKSKVLMGTDVRLVSFTCSFKNQDSVTLIVGDVTDLE